jgi:hypothetical protein
MGILEAELSVVVMNRIRKVGRALLALLLSYSLAPASAQESLPDPAIYKPANDEEAARLEKAWLHSKDLRLVAWGAYLAGNESRRELIPDLIERTGLNDSRWDSNGAATLVLDALIHLKAQVPVERSMGLLHSFSFDQMRLILVSRVADNTAALQQILKETGGIATVNWLATADLLALHPPPGFAAQMLAALQPSLTANIVDDQTPPVSGQGGGQSCGDRGPAPVTIGWPPIRFYGISTKGDTPLAAGAHPVFYYEAQLDQGEPYFSCIPYGREYEMPRGIASDLAKMKLDDFPLRHEATAIIHYIDAASYPEQIRMVLQKANDDFERVISAYLRDGLMTQSEAGELKLAVGEMDLRGAPHAPPLPKRPMFRWLK